MRKKYIAISIIMTALFVLEGCTPEAETITSTVTQPTITVTTSLPMTTVTTTVAQPASTFYTTVTKTITTTPITPTATLFSTTATTTPTQTRVVMEVKYIEGASLAVFLRNLQAIVTSTEVIGKGRVQITTAAVSPKVEVDVEIQCEFYDGAGTLLGTSELLALHLSKFPGYADFELPFSTADPSEVQKCIVVVSVIE